MRTKSQLIIAVVAAALIALSTTGGTTGQESKAQEKDQQRDITTLELAISQDGRSIVDQNGKIVANFVDDIRVQMKTPGVKADAQVVSKAESQKMQDPKAASLKLAGCMRCVPTCLIYDKDGKCVKYYQSCTWDFDCK